MSDSYVCAAMCVMEGTSKRARAGLVVLALAAALLALAVGPATAGAADTVGSIFGPSMKLTFTGGKVRVAAGRAVVGVKCRGARGGTCAGTVVLRIAGGDHEVAFSVGGGERRRLVVPLGGEGPPIGKQRRVRAIASTVQPLGSCRESRRLLRLR